MSKALIRPTKLEVANYVLENHGIARSLLQLRFNLAEG
jgi:hypothetical protein